MIPSEATSGKLLELLNQFANLLLEADTEVDVAWSIAKQAIAHLGFEDCVIYLMDPTEDVLRQTAAHGPKAVEGQIVQDPLVIPVGKGIVGAAAATKEVQNIEDVRSDGRYILDDEQRVSELAVPMMHRGECLGVVDSEDHRTGFYTDDHVSILTTVAALGAARIVHIRAMQELETSRAEFRELVEHASDIVFRANKRGRFVYVNPVAVHLTGYTREELMTMRFDDLVASGERRRVRSFYRDQFRDLRTNTYLEFRFRKKNGELRWIGQNLQLILDGSEVAGFQAIARDITVLKQAQDAVSRSQAIQQAMLDASLDAIISIDESGNVIEFNPAAERIFGFSFEEAYGQRLVELIIPEDLRTSHSAGMRRLVETGTPKLIGKRVEVPALHKDGHIFPIELSLTRIQLADTSQFTAFVRDITDRKQNEKDLNTAREEAESYAQAQTKFLSSMSHEIRTPLNAVIGISHLIQQTSLSPKQEKYVLDILSAGKVLLGLINNILDFQKIESGFLQLENVTFNLHDILEEVLDRAKYLVMENPIQVGFDRADDVPNWVKGDPVRLNQILMNLLSNAIKFTAEGDVNLSVTCVATTPLLVQFVVSDTGIGIPEDARNRVFDAFSQASTDITRRFGGSGLGLPIVKELVKALGGSVELKSEEGSGSTFLVTLPLQLSSDEEIMEQVADHADMNLQDVRVLLVEDNPINQLVASELLESWEALVKIAPDGYKALSMLTEERFDIVLMDIQMPGMDGIETVARIRNDLGLDRKALPVIALTASALRERRDKAYDAGMTDFIMKPFDPAHLHSRILHGLGLRASRGVLERVADAPGQEELTQSVSIIDMAFFEENYGHHPTLRSKTMEKIRELLPSQRQAIQKALSEGNPDALRFMAHKLLSTLRMVGAHTAESLCAQVDDRQRSDEDALLLGKALPAVLESIEVELSTMV